MTAIKVVNKPRADDERLLEMLHMRDVEGKSVEEICRRFKLTKGTALGMMHRALIADDEMRCRCFLAVHKNGGMKPKWWAV